MTRLSNGYLLKAIVVAILVSVACLASCDTFTPGPESRYDPRYLVTNEREADVLKRYREELKQDRERRQYWRRMAPCSDGQRSCIAAQTKAGIDQLYDSVCLECRLACERRLDVEGVEPWPPNCREHGNQKRDDAKFRRENAPPLPPNRGLKIRVRKASD